MVKSENPRQFSVLFEALGTPRFRIMKFSTVTIQGIIMFLPEKKIFRVFLLVFYPEKTDTDHLQSVAGLRSRSILMMKLKDGHATWKFMFDVCVVYIYIYMYIYNICICVGIYVYTYIYIIYIYILCMYVYIYTW